MRFIFFGRPSISSFSFLLFTFLLLSRCVILEAGIDGFWKWYQDQFYDTIMKVKPGQTAEFEHVLIDANHLLHKAARRAKNLDDCLRRLRTEIRRSLKSCTPTKTLVIAFDGSAPIAKLKHQQERRADSKVNRYETISPLLLSPGTDFMKLVAEDIEKLAKEIVKSNRESNPRWNFLKLKSKTKIKEAEKISVSQSQKRRQNSTTVVANPDFETSSLNKSNRERSKGKKRVEVTDIQDNVTNKTLSTKMDKYSDLKIYLSATDSPGEGEVKIIDWINTYVHNNKDRIVVIGADADLLIQGLALPGLPNFHIYMPQEKRTALLISLHLLILKLESLFPGQSHNIRNDMVLLLILNGNDYLPKVRGLNFKRGFRTYTALRKEYSKLNEEGIKQNIKENVSTGLKSLQNDQQKVKEDPLLITKSEKEDHVMKNKKDLGSFSEEQILNVKKESIEDKKQKTTSVNLKHDGWGKENNFADKQRQGSQSKLLPGEKHYLINPIDRTFNWTFLLAFLTKLKSIITVPENLTSISQAPTPASILFEITQQKRFGDNTDMTIEYYYEENSKQIKEVKGRSSRHENSSKAFPHAPPLKSKWSCTLSVGGHSFELEELVKSKKIAKQTICRKALLSLAPDVYNHYFILSSQSNLDPVSGDLIEEEHDILKEEHQMRHMMKQEEEIKAHLNARKDEYIEMYLKGLLWTIQMYIDGHCADYTYLYKNPFAPTVASIAGWLAKNYEANSSFVLKPPVSSIQPFPAEIACIAMFPEDKMEELIPNQLQSAVASHPSIKNLQKEGKLNSIEELLKLCETVGVDALGWNKRPIPWTVIQENSSNLNTETKLSKVIKNQTMKEGGTNNSTSMSHKVKNTPKKIRIKKIKGRVVSPFRSWAKPLLAPFYVKGTKIGKTPINFRFQRKGTKSGDSNNEASRNSKVLKSDQKESGKIVESASDQNLTSLKNAHTKSNKEKSHRKGKRKASKKRLSNKLEVKTTVKAQEEQISPLVSTSSSASSLSSAAPHHIKTENNQINNVFESHSQKGTILQNHHTRNGFLKEPFPLTNHPDGKLFQSNPIGTKVNLFSRSSSSVNMLTLGHCLKATVNVASRMAMKM